MAENKECFVISPIGSPGTDIRSRSDKLMNHIISPAVENFDYTAIRADDISEPGSITSQVIEKTIESELVIADLTGHNPNVFYELGIRHAFGKPYIQLIEADEDLPFDISDYRTIHFTFDVEQAKETVSTIEAQIEAIEQDDAEVDTPISEAAERKSLRESGDPVDKNVAEILDVINKLDKRMDHMENKLKSPTFPQVDKSWISAKSGGKQWESVAIPEDSLESKGAIPEKPDFNKSISFKSKLNPKNVDENEDE